MIKFFKRLFLRIRLFFQFRSALKEYRKLVKNTKFLEDIRRPDVSYVDYVKKYFR